MVFRNDLVDGLNMKLKNLLLPALLALLTSVTCVAARAQPVSFGLFGDTPYNRW